MKRRQFIQVATSSLLIPATLAVSRTTPALPLEPAPDRFFFDERFTSVHGVSDAIAVRSEVTPFWFGDLDELSHRQPLKLQGVTTESFRFCLDVLLRDRALVSTQVSRQDSNLLLWTMRSTPRGIEESFHG